MHLMYNRTYVLLCSDRKLTSLVAGEASPSSAWATGSLTGFWEFVCVPLVRYRVSSTASSLLDATVLLQFADLNISFYTEQSQFTKTKAPPKKEFHCLK